MIGASSGVGSDIPAGARVVGTPAEPARDFMRGVMALRRLRRSFANAKTDDGAGG